MSGTVVLPALLLVCMYTLLDLMDINSLRSLSQDPHHTSDIRCIFFFITPDAFFVFCILFFINVLDFRYFIYFLPPPRRSFLFFLLALLIAVFLLLLLSSSIALVIVYCFFTVIITLIDMIVITAEKSYSFIVDADNALKG